MKNKLALLALVMLVFSSPVYAQQRGPMSADDKHACTVALCLANPSGPTATRECRSAIGKLNRDLARGKATPHCRFLNNGNNRTNSSGTNASNNRQANSP